MKTRQYSITNLSDKLRYSPGFITGSNHYEKDTGMEVPFLSKDVNILITIVEVAWW